MRGHRFLDRGSYVDGGSRECRCTRERMLSVYSKCLVTHINFIFPFEYQSTLHKSKTIR